MQGQSLVRPWVRHGPGLVHRRPAFRLSRSFAILAHTWTRPGRGKSLPAFTEPLRVAVFLHGILGSKANWNTPARRLLEEIGPLGWRVLQLDLRAHGQSPLGEGPHTLDSCAADVLETLTDLGVDLEEHEVVVCGHSFGGKVALALALACSRVGRRLPRRTWTLDSVPGFPVELSLEQQKREQSVGFVLQVIEAAAQGVFRERSTLIAALEQKHGLEPALARWAAQSVREVPGGIRLAYDMNVIRELYDAYRETDLWHVLHSGQGAFGVVVAGRNRHAWGEANLEQLAKCGELVQVVELADAGHNVHVDDLKGLLGAIKTSFQ